MSQAPWEPPFAGSEVEHLVGMLDRLRWTFRWKADGLTREQLAVRVGASELSIGVLLKHLAYVEDSKFQWCLRGRRPMLLDEVPDGTDPRTWSLTVDAAESAESLYQRWDAAVARSRALLAEILAEGGLDTPSAIEFDGIVPSKRRFVCDMIEEYGRHTGHADLIREAIDGRVGEDPPADWRPGRTL